MPYNYIKPAFRALRRDRLYTLLNLLGLAIGTGAALLVLIWVQDELTYDTQHKKGDQIVRVLTNWDFGGTREWTPQTPALLAAAAKAEIPEVQDAVRLWQQGSKTLKSGAALFEAKNCIIADQNFFELFDFPILRSDGSQPLATSNGIMLTASLARTIFADADPLGKILRYNNKLDLVVTAILKDPPSNSSIQFSCLLPFEPLMNQLVQSPQQYFHWGQMSFTTWLLMRPDANREAVAHKLAAIVARNRKADDAFWYALQPLKQVYLDSGFLSRYDKLGDRKTIGVFGLIGLLILGIACINYVNLATARASRRAKEVGVRKTIGAGSRQLFRQFMTESALMILLASLLGVGFALAALPTFNELSGKNLAAADFYAPTVLRVIVVSALLTLILAGIYPALLLTRFEPVRVLKGQSLLSGGNPILRKGLVITQFVVSIALMITALAMSKQMEYLRNAKLGYEKENILTFATWGSQTPPKVIKSMLAEKAGIQAVSMSDNEIVDLGSQSGGTNWEGQPAGKELPLWRISVDEDFTHFFGLQLREGRWFRSEMNGCDTLSFILNETAVHEMGFREGEGTGKWIKFNGIKGTIVGVVKNFNFQSLHRPIEPLILTQDPGWTNNIYLKTNAGKTEEAIQAAKTVFEQTCPGKIFKYEFLDDQYDALYKSEARTGSLFSLFAGLAILISCLGLLGLATFSARQRTKEIGIRKVLGASVTSVTRLLTRDFLILVFIAFLLALPIGWWTTQHWLKDFAYQIKLSWMLFGGVGLVSLVAAAFTVGFQTIRAALENPVNALKNE